MLIILVGGLA